MSPSETERSAKKQPDGKSVPIDRELSDSELESVAGGVKSEPPPPPPGKPTKP
jgi:hypothetical protein